jgi:TonB-linked SusC/RagA family outer membrane protein
MVLGALPSSVAAQHPVSGTVSSAEDGRLVAGAVVTIAGAQVSTLTATNGRFTLQARTPNDTLVISMIGYAEQRVAIDGRSVVNVSLTAQAIGLEGIVVVGYGQQQRRDVTGAVASVSGERLKEIATPSVEQAIQGRVAGVQVTPSSGQPGAGAVVRIRGVGTLNNASPLYVVDGMLTDDISFLSPNDIASMEVLKDASATAIYGSRGANGVIIISTTKGSLDRPTTFTFNAYAGTQTVLNTLDLVNGREYAMLANELATNLNQPNPYFPDPNAVGEGIDWQDAIFEAAPIQSYQVASSGGTEKITYYFSGNFFRQDGVVPRSRFTRATLRLNNDYQLTENFLVGHNISFSYTDGNNPPSILSELYRADPTIAPRNDAGAFNDMSVRTSAGNPAATVFYTHNDRDGKRLVGNLFAELNVLNNFTLRSSFGLDLDGTDVRSFSPVFVVSPTQQNVESDLDVEQVTNNSWLWENTLTYNYGTEQHRFTALAGITAQSFYHELLGGRRVNIVGEGENLWFLEAGDAEGQTNKNNAEDWRMLSYLFRGNYSFMSKYLLTASLRIDGSSRFGAENRYGYFPSVALGWNLSDEPFFNIEAINALKLRGSWGQIGNDKIGAYPGTQVITGNLNAIFGPDESPNFGATATVLANPDVKWERTSQFNIGADVSLFGSRLEGTFDYYRRTTDGILVRVPIPRYVGVGEEPFVNAAEVLNSGIEGALTWNHDTDAFGLEIRANAATVNNEVRELGGGREEILGGGLGNEVTFTTRTVPGEPIGSFWGFKVAGVFQNAGEVASLPRRGGEAPGDLRYADLNGDGTITEDDKTFIGSPIPDVVYGFGATMNVKSFDLSANFSGQAGNEVYNGKKAVRFGVENYERSFLDRWHGEGTSTTEPRITNAGHNYVASDRFIENGSFLKLHSAQVGYTLPESLSNRLRMSRTRLYVNGTNLFYASDYSGYTPELTATSVIANGIDLFGGVFPPARTITFGLDVSF